MAAKKRILSIDGGGVRGILAGEVLLALEKKLQSKTNNEDARLADFFDFFAGTSTGAILACIYLTPSGHDSSKPLYSAQDAVNLYLQNSRNIFRLKYLTSRVLKGKYLNNKYSVKGIEIVLDAYFQKLKLSELIKPCLIPAYDVLKRQAHFFTQHEAVKEIAYDYYIKDVTRSTSAAPGFFAPAQIKSLTGVSYMLADGGIFAHNPAFCAYAEAKQLYNGIKADEMLFVSIGSGRLARSTDVGSKIEISRYSKKIRPKEIMLAGVADPVDFQLRQLFDEADAGDNYFRFNPKLGKANAVMDDASQKNLLALKDAGEYFAKTADDELEKLADLLVANE